MGLTYYRYSTEELLEYLALPYKLGIQCLLLSLQPQPPTSVCIYNSLHVFIILKALDYSSLIPRPRVDWGLGRGQDAVAS